MKNDKLSFVSPNKCHHGCASHWLKNMQGVTCFVPIVFAEWDLCAMLSETLRYTRDIKNMCHNEQLKVPTSSLIAPLNFDHGPQSYRAV